MRFLLLTILLIMAASDGFSLTTEDCQLPFLLLGYDCLYFSDRQVGDGSEMSWDQAREACKLLGGDLAHDFDVEKLLKEWYFLHTYDICGWRGESWVGARDKTVPGYYTWLDSNRIVEGPWYITDSIDATREPDGEGETEQCVWLIMDGTYALNQGQTYKGFGDDDCGANKPFICQK